MAEPPFFNTSVCIIGGRGRMGRRLAGLLEALGCRVSISDACDGPLDLELVAASQVVCLAVPAPAVAQVMAAIGPSTRADGLVMDLTSLKEAPLQAMTRHARGAVVGCHPLFGPESDPQGQVVFVCPGRGLSWLAWVEALWRSLGCTVEHVDPSHHDRLMATAQSLRHLLLAGLGRALERMGFDPAQAPLAGPWTGALLGMLRHQLGQPGELYADLALANPAAGQALAALQGALADLGAALGDGDRDGLAALLDGPAAWTAGLPQDLGQSGAGDREGRDEVPRRGLRLAAS